MSKSIFMLNGVIILVGLFAVGAFAQGNHSNLPGADRVKTTDADPEQRRTRVLVTGDYTVQAKPDTDSSGWRNEEKGEGQQHIHGDQQ